MYAVIDTETTGLSVGWRHRVLEIAVVQTDVVGRVEHEWCTIVNADRDLGPQHIHGISAAEAAAAPRFEEVAAHLLELLSDRVIVAHNLPFDLMFLRAEYERLGVAFPVRRELGLCTMTWSRWFLPGTGRSLKECCSAAGVPLTGWHSAVSDARATAGLLRHYLATATTSDTADHLPVVSEGFEPAAMLRQVRELPWPVMAPARFESKVRAAAPSAQIRSSASFVAGLTDYMPRVDSSELADPYLAVLDQALADRYLSADESAVLSTLATNLGLDTDEVLRLHRDYLDALVRVALADRHLSGEETSDLYQVADVLGLPGHAVSEALRRADGPCEDAGRLPVIRPGDMIVFTGDMGEPRESWERWARDHGYVPHPAVTKNVKLVVAADPNSPSGKAKKARGYDIPIVGVDVFRAALSDPVPGLIDDYRKPIAKIEGIA